MIEENIQIPLIALRGMVVFPKTSFSFDLSRLKSIEALENAMVNNQKIFLVSQKNPLSDEIAEKDLYKVGVIAKIKQILRLPGNLMRVVAEGIEKAEIEKIVREKPFFLAEVRIIEERTILSDEQKIECFLNMLHEAFEKYTALSRKMSPDFIMQILSEEEPIAICNLLSSKIDFKLNEKQAILEETDDEQKMLKVLKAINREIELLNIQNEINIKVKEKIDKSQREYYLREQAKVIQSELGEKEGIKQEIEDYRDKMKSLKLPEIVEQRLDKELLRLKRMSLSSAEGTVSRDYIELLLDLPWSQNSKESIDLKKAKNILEKDHFGLEKIKERIIEFIAVRKNTNGNQSPILCFVGPPGVGKTSIAKSIANALNRKYIRIALGGVRDEAEIRGHRKTYIGAMPGRIISSIKQVQTNNPLILLDEIDKLASDYKGDPASALLEVLDSEQNFNFRDNYLELPFDISNVLFICTANNVETIPSALKDRLEIIELSSYTKEEKINIAYKFLIDKQLKKHGLKKSNFKIKKDVIPDIIQYYTREAGVRQLERLIASLCRKAVTKMMFEDVKSVSITKNNITDFLGKKKFKDDKLNKDNEIGIVRGLAWTSVGGETLSIEVNTMKGKGNFKLTGNVGKVMEESAQAGISYIRANSDKFKLDNDFYEKLDIHIHIPEGAVPKDGPSAGITMATAMFSALTSTPIRNDIAMTGEITLRGKVLPIGGLKEKILAAKRIGVHKIIIPFENASDLDELPNYVKEGIEFVLAENMDEVIENSIVSTNNINVNENTINDDIIIEDKNVVENSLTREKGFN